MKMIEQAKAILDNQGATSGELESLLNELKARRNEAEGRRFAISLNAGSIKGVGAERRQAQNAGDVDLVQKMDEEERSLIAELSVLESLQDRVRKRFDETKAQENIKGAADAYDKLAFALDAHQQAEAAQRQASQAVDNLVSDIRACRHHTERMRQQYPDAPAKLLQQYMQVAGYQYSDSALQVGWFAPGGGNPALLQAVADALGVPVPRGREQVA